MSIIDAIAGSAQIPRGSDGLTPDHPARPYPAIHRLRASAWMRLLVFAAVFFVTAILSMSVFMAVTLSTAMNQTQSMLVTELIPAIVAYLVLTLAMEDRIWPSELSPKTSGNLLKGMALGVVLVGLAVGVLALIGSYRVVGVNAAYNPWAALLTIGVTAGIAEEILFRGVLFRLVEEGLGSWGAVAVSALGFGAVHLTNPDATWWGAIAIAVEAGVLFAGVYVLTRNLWWCIGLHFAWNMAEGPLFGSIVSGTGANSSWLQAQWSGPELLTGGRFGLEASVVPVIIGAALGVLLLVHAHRRGLIVAPAWIRQARLNPAPITLDRGLPS
ncbi:MAG: CPBP family intramembrane metalloprotease [Propionibacteriaceae bacterium]|jgi:membrane protease YdiL (CAAX protease family)|nr:CPBP family intramembrane metalloprotease [Propionibacteriaceae bacterium]